MGALGLQDWGENSGLNGLVEDKTQGNRRGLDGGEVWGISQSSSVMSCRSSE